MARLQKKKSAQARQKKRVKQNGEGSVPTTGGTGGQVMTARTGADKGLGKKITVRARKPVAAGKKPSWIQKSIQFLREVKVELKKVTWPSRKQTIGSTIVVLALVVLISLFLGLVDMGLTSFVKVVLQ